MIYQVLGRAHADAAWEPFQAMTRDPQHALALLRRAGRIYGEVSVIQAESAHVLREQAQRLRAGEPSGYEASATPSLTATPRLSLVTGEVESQRWAMERGPGGDHDIPYRFEPFVPAHTLRRWSRLMARAHRRAADATSGSATSGSATSDGGSAPDARRAV